MKFTLLLLVVAANCASCFRQHSSAFKRVHSGKLGMISQEVDHIFKTARKISIIGIASLLSSVVINGQDTSNQHIQNIPSITFSTAAQAAEVPVIGSVAPEFSLPSNVGKELSLKSFPGKRIVLYFYPGDFTQGCTIEAQGFQRDIAKYNNLGVQIIGVSVDSVEKHLDFGKSYGLDFPLLSDQGGVVSSKYGSLLDFGFIGKFSNRQTYIISPDDHKIEYVFTDVEGKVAKHSEDVLAKLEQLK